jgi:hypothetical protein
LPNKPHAFPRYRIKRGSQILLSLYGVCRRECNRVQEINSKFGDRILQKVNSSNRVLPNSRAGNASIGEPRSLQNLALPRDTFAEAGCGKIFTERLSGAVTDRPALREALEFARRGDTLIANPDFPIIQIA